MHNGTKHLEDALISRKRTDLLFPSEKTLLRTLILPKENMSGKKQCVYNKILRFRNIRVKATQNNLLPLSETNLHFRILGHNPFFILCIKLCIYASV